MSDLSTKERSLFFHTYKRLGVDIVKGEGMYLTDRSGRSYLDFFGGLAVNALGNAHPGIIRAITEQAERYIHLSNFFVQEPQVRLVEQLLKLTGFSRAFLCNSGTEALEGAVKLARKWGGSAGKRRAASPASTRSPRGAGPAGTFETPARRRSPQKIHSKTAGLPANRGWVHTVVSRTWRATAASRPLNRPLPIPIRPSHASRANRPRPSFAEIEDRTWARRFPTRAEDRDWYNSPPEPR